MFLLRLFILVILFTGLGAGIFYFDQLKPVGEAVFAYYKGEHAFRNEDYKAATAHYQKALAHYPDPSAAYIKLGDAQADLGNKQQALQAYEKAARLNPQSEQALAKLSGQASWQEKSQGWLQQVTGGLPWEPSITLPDASNLLASWQSWVGQFGRNEIAQQYQEAERLYAEGQYEEALGQYCSLTLEHPDSPETLYSLAVAFSKNGAAESAHKYMTQAAEFMVPNNPELAQEWAMQANRLHNSRLTYLGEPSEAVESCLLQLAAAEAEGKPKH